jgi:hypothetical protein
VSGAGQLAVDVAVAVAGAELAGADLAQHRTGLAAHLVGGHPLGGARVLEHDRRRDGLAIGARPEFGRGGVRIVHVARNGDAVGALGSDAAAATIAARSRLGVTGTRSSRAPVACRIAGEDRRRGRDQGRLADALGAPRTERLRVLDQVHRDRRHVADRRDQVVVQVVGAAVDVLLHQRHPDALRDAAVDLAFDLRRVDRATDVVRGMDVQQPHGAELEIDFDLGDLRGEAVGRVRHALAIGIERHGRRVEMAAAGEEVAVLVGDTEGEVQHAPPVALDRARKVCTTGGSAANADEARSFERQLDIRLGLAVEAERADQLAPDLEPGEPHGIAGDEGLARRRRLAGIGSQVGVAHHLLDARQREADGVGEHLRHDRRGALADLLRAVAEEESRPTGRIEAQAAVYRRRVCDHGVADAVPHAGDAGAAPTCG